MTYYNDITECNARIEKLEAVVKAAADIHHYHQEWGYVDCEETPLVPKFQLDRLGKTLTALDAKEAP